MSEWHTPERPPVPQPLDGVALPSGLEALDLSLAAHRAVVADMMMERGWPRPALGEDAIANLSGLLGLADEGIARRMAARFALTVEWPADVAALLATQAAGEAVEVAEEEAARKRFPATGSQVSLGHLLHAVLDGDHGATAECLVLLASHRESLPIQGQEGIYVQLLAIQARCRREVATALVPLALEVLLG